MSTTDRVVVGVDAGGSTTRAAVAVAGEIVRSVDGPGANASLIGVHDAADAILTTIRRALDHERPAAIAVGAAGAGRAAVADELRDLIAGAYGDARVVVADDTAIALRGAIPAGPGIALIAGTGSCAYAEHGEVSVRVGGLGYLAGDEGSAFAIGMAAVRAYGRVLDGRLRPDETTALVARLLDAPDRDAYLSAMYDRPLVPATIASLAPAVIAFAGKGNRVAGKIVQAAALELGDLVKSAAAQARLTDASPAVALCGGLFNENSMLTFLIETRIVGDLPGASIVRGGNALAGAVRVAHALAA
jgi:N-acetylglucosamine kinase-like BadF-type ATPase